MFEQFINSAAGCAAIATSGCKTVSQAISVIHQAYRSMVHYGLEHEVFEDVKNGSSFLDACQDWDLI